MLCPWCERPDGLAVEMRSIYGRRRTTTPNTRRGRRAPPRPPSPAPPIPRRRTGCSRRTHASVPRRCAGSSRGRSSSARSSRSAARRAEPRLLRPGQGLRGAARPSPASSAAASCSCRTTSGAAPSRSAPTARGDDVVDYHVDHAGVCPRAASGAAVVEPPGIHRPRWRARHPRMRRPRRARRQARSCRRSRGRCATSTTPNGTGVVCGVRRAATSSAADPRDVRRVVAPPAHRAVLLPAPGEVRRSTPPATRVRHAGPRGRAGCATRSLEGTAAGHENSRRPAATT